MNRTLARGMTLIESVAAIVILAVAIPPLLWALRGAHAQRVNPAMAATARWLVVEKLEDIIADRHSSTRGYTWLVPANYPAENPVPGFAGFTRTVALTETEADLITAGTGYMRVAVTVSWTDAAAILRDLTVETVVTEH